MVNIQDGKTVTVTVGDGSIEYFYYELGDPAGDPVVFLHTGGAGVSSYQCWHLNLDAVAEAGYHVLAVDAPGFGRSSPGNAVEGLAGFPRRPGHRQGAPGRQLRRRHDGHHLLRTLPGPRAQPDHQRRRAPAGHGGHASHRPQAGRDGPHELRPGDARQAGAHLRGHAPRERRLLLRPHPPGGRGGGADAAGHPLGPGPAAAGA